MMTVMTTGDFNQD